MMRSSGERRGKGVQLGLIGWPLEHSQSPALHGSALRAAGLQGEYRLYPLPPTKDGHTELGVLLDRLRAGELRGLNVTIPYKETLVTMLDDLTPPARAIGAVNTLLVKGDVLLGDNTDAPGFLSDLKRLPEPRRRVALVLGAGGAARAVVFVLVQAGWQVHIAARRVQQARQLAAEMTLAVREQPVVRQGGSTDMGPGETARVHGVPHPPPLGKVLNIDILPLQPEALARIIPLCGLLVNCTPVGMSPDLNQSPWPSQVPFPPHAGVYDLVYNPLETALVRAAKRNGLPAVTGLGMLVEQAALSFEIWTGVPASREAMWAAVT